MKKMLCILLAAAMILCGCGDKEKASSRSSQNQSYAEEDIDFKDEAEFEAALNRGENLIGKVVRFKVLEIHPDTDWGYDLWAGEHLNFIFPEPQDYKVGDEVTVRVDTVQKLARTSYNSWIINNRSAIDNSGKSSDYTMEIKIDDISFFLPENSTITDNGTYVNYYTDEGYVTISESESRADLKNADIHSSYISDMFLSGMKENLTYSEFRYLNDRKAIYYELHVEANGRSAESAGLIMLSSGKIVAFAVNGGETAENSRAFLEKIVSHMEINGESVEMTKAEQRIDTVTKKTTASDPEPVVLQKSFSKFHQQGIGSQVIRDITLPSVVCIVHAEHNGNSNFIVKYYNASGSKALLKNEIGSVNSYQVYDGTKYSSSGSGMMEVTADGGWNLTFIPLTDHVSSNIRSSFSGKGDSVVGCFKASGLTVCKASHNGNSNFIVDVYEYSETGKRILAFNEIGRYNGETVLRTQAGKTYFFNVRADGNWTIDLE